MNERYMVNLYGKSYVLYEGLLAKAHEVGIKSIEEELLQIPSPDNNNVAIVKATVVTEEGRRFQGHGDASPENVGKAISTHLPRMASTRAKARALRDMLGVGATAFEELASDAPVSNQPTRTPQAAPGQAQGGKSSGEAERTPGGATVKAAEFLKDLAHKNYGSAEAYEQTELSGGKVEQMSAKAVKREIERLR